MSGPAPAKDAGTGVPERAGSWPRRRAPFSGCGRFTRWLKGVWGLVKAKPHIVIVPLVLFGLLVGFGVFGVSRASAASASSSKEQATTVAQSFASDFQHALSIAAIPLAQTAAVIAQSPYYPHCIEVLNSAFPALWRAAPQGTYTILANPFGTPMVAYPTSALVQQYLGVDGMQATNVVDTTNKMRFMQFRPTPESGPPVYFSHGLANLMMTVWVKNATSPDFNFSSVINTTFCQQAPQMCYDPTLGQWWGMINLAMDFNSFSLLTQAVNNLHIMGYRVQVMRPGYADAGEPATVPVLPAAHLAPPGAPTSSLLVGDEYWHVYVWKCSWQPSWMRAMYAVVVVGAFVICMLLASVLYSWEEHRALLHSLLPAQTIQRMRDEAAWTTNKLEDIIQTVSLETPAKNMLQIIAACLRDDKPSLQQLLAVRDALQRSADVYKPTVEHLKGRMKESEFVDAEVRQALVAQLVGGDADPDARITLTLPAPSAADGNADERPSSNPLQYRTMKTWGQLTMTSAAEGQQQDTVSLHAILTSTGKQGIDPALADVDLQRDVYQMLPHVMGLTAPPELIGAAKQPVPGGDAASPAALQHEQTGVPEDAGDADKLPGRGKEVTVPAPVLTQLEVVLGTTNDWCFDTYALEAASYGRPLSVLAYFLLHTSGLMEWAHMDSLTLVRFLHQAEDLYPDNPYHNRRHAANVLQCMHVIIHRGGLLPGYVDPLTMLGCYLAAIVHDVGHLGCNNDYLVNSHDDLAVRYNDKSPLESHHVATAYGLLKQPGLNVLSGLSKPNWQKLRKLVIDLVLATDMKAHFATTGQFEALVRTDAIIDSLAGRTDSMSLTRDSPRNSAVSVHMQHNPLATHASGCASPPMMAPATDAERVLSLQMALKCADVGHLTSPLASHLRWVQALEQEFFMQGDAERALGLPVSPLCDRNKEGVTKSQVGFFDFVVNPMMRAFCTRFRQCKPLWHALMDNYKFWQAAAAKADPAAALKARPSTQREGLLGDSG